MCNPIFEHLSNSDNLISLSVTGSVAASVPARVFITLDVLSFLGFTPLGKTDLLIIVFVAPESNKTLRNRLLWIATMVDAVHIEAGVSVAMRLHLGNGTL